MNNLGSVEKIILFILGLGTLLSVGGILFNIFILKGLGILFLGFVTFLFYPEILSPASDKIGFFSMEHVKHKWLWIGFMWYGLLSTIVIFYWAYNS